MARQDKKTRIGDNTALLIGSKLRQARELKNISLTEMSKRVDYTKSYLSGVETGKERASEALVRRYERELALQPGELVEAVRALRTETTFTFTFVAWLFAKSVPSWLYTLQDIWFDKGEKTVIEDRTASVYSLLHLDEKEQLRHLELALKNATERGLAQFHTIEEREQYRDILIVLSEQGTYSDTLRREVMRLFALSETPDLTELNEAYNRSLRTRALSQPTPPTGVDAAPYLSSFFEALIAELYDDPFFRQQLREVLQLRYAKSMRRSLVDVVATLRQIGETLGDNYRPEQFEQDVQQYIELIERSFRYLKLVGVVPKDHGSENKDPELEGVFVQPSIMMEDPQVINVAAPDFITNRLESFPCLVLLGGPGSGKSMITRYLAWSHALANLPDSSPSLTNISLLSGKPLPLRIELRRLSEDRKQQLDYDFLSYATEVLLGREGVEINSQIFKELLERRTMLLLFDGLDEVATLDERSRLVGEIEQFALTYPGNRILVTSRPVGYELAPFSNQWFSHARMQEFNDEQIRQFLERWYTHVLRLSPIPYNDRQELEALFTTLKENPRLHKLAENPLLLTVITALHRYERLPDRRVLVYDRCADLLLETWAKLRGTKDRWKDMRMIKEDQYACVAHLGFVLQEHSQEKESDEVDTEDSANDVPARLILREIERFLSTRKLITEVVEQRAEAKRFLELIQVEAGLIIERGTDESGEALYGFIHRTFQEYFAAADVYERYQEEADPAIITEFLQEHLYNPHWREVILLLLGKLKRKLATAQLRQVLEGKIKSHRSQYTDLVEQDLFFVCDCLLEEIGVENELAELVVLRLGDLVKMPSTLPLKTKALDALVALIHTRQYSDLARKELTALAIQDSTIDVSTKIRAAQLLYKNSSADSYERNEAAQRLRYLAERHKLVIEKLVRDAEEL